MRNINKKNLNLYKSFYEVALEKSYTKAAEKLYLTQPSLSYNVKTLEKDLNLKLINRGKNEIKLTSDGKILFDTLTTVFHLLEQAEEKISNKKNLSGLIRIGSTRNISDYFLNEYINDFIKKYPNLKLSIIIEDSTTLIKKLEINEIDVIFDNLPISNSFLELSSLIVYEFETIFACNGRLYNEVKDKIKKAIDLSEYPLVLPGKSEKRKNIDKLFLKKGIVINPQLELPNSNLMINIVKNNNFIGLFIKDSIEEELKNKELYQIPIEENIENNKIVMLSLKNTTNIIPKLFIEFIESQINRNNL